MRHAADRRDCPQRAPAGPSAMGVDTAARPHGTRPHAPSGLASARVRRSSCVPKGAALGRVAMRAKLVTFGKAKVS
jgi:hypothetical protein